jgi:ABC-type Fe3+/spermidine/putrescine transport system ATPase subunit/ABC-type sulfate transport system permease component
MPAQRDGLTWILGGLAALLVAYLMVPLLAVFGRLSASGLAQTFRDPAAWKALGLSVGAATIAVALAMALGVPLAYLLVRKEFRGKALVRAAVVLPLVLPPIVGGLLLTLVVGPNGYLGRFFEQAGISIINTWPAVVLAQLFVAAPFVVISAETAFRGVDPRLERAAASLGRAPGYVFLHVTLPLARTGLLAGLVLGWLRALGEFGATAVLAFNPRTLPVATWVVLTGEGFSAALPLAVMSLSVTAIALLALQVVERGPFLLSRPSGGGPLRGPAFAGRRWSATPADEAEPARWDHTPSLQGGDGGRLELDVEHAVGGFSLQASLTAEPGILVLFGPSGSGKTTLLNCIAGLASPRRGSIVLDGRTLLRKDGTGAGVHLPPHLRRVAVVFQDYSLFPHLRVMENVLFGTPAAPADVARAREVLAMCRLDGLNERYPHQLSGGQQQRVALARALVTQPGVLLLDEPFSALDSNVREKLQMDLLRLQQRLGLTVIHVTHDLREALVLADRIAVLHEGRVIQVGSKDEVLRRPAGEAAARFLGTRNMLTGRVEAGSDRGTLVATGALRLWTPALTLEVGTEVRVFVRPEEITPLWNGADGGGRENVVEAVSVAEQDRGLVWRVFLRPGRGTPGEEELVMDVPAHEYEYYRVPLLSGGRVPPWTVLVPQDRLHIVPVSDGAEAVFSDS